MNKLTVAVAVSAAAFLAVASPAGAERADKNQGVGVCSSQLAIIEGGIGDQVKGLHSATPGVLDEARNACGEPPGPGHLG